jgi:hypothetical protein
MYYASQERARAVNNSRSLTRRACTEAGIQLARAFYGRNYVNWNTYLSNPAIYDPTVPPPGLASNPWDSSLQSNHPELFTDLDGDGLPDVYVYIRDNWDELPPATNNTTRDNDQIVIVGAVCISNTLVPRRGDGSLEESGSAVSGPNGLTVEGLLSYNDPNQTYCSQASGCGLGQGNLNH